MGFDNNIGCIRKLGRKIVLPTDVIKKTVKELLFSNDEYQMKTVIDVGAGTLYWSEWLSKYANRVHAVDLVYADGEQRKIVRGGAEIICSNDIGKVIEENNDKNTMVWMCDVLHHMPKPLADDIFKLCLKKYRYIVVKDINCRHRFGNFMNRLHDRVINKEIIRDIDPVQLKQIMVKNHFKVQFYEMKRLWYPHFLLVAVKE